MVSLPEVEMELKALRASTAKFLQEAKARSDQLSTNTAQELLGQIDDALDDLAINNLKKLSATLTELRTKLDAATKAAKTWPIGSAGLNTATSTGGAIAMPIQMFTGVGRALDSETFGGAAETLGVDAAKLWAVVEIEAKRCGFLPDRRPVILFERHKFHEKTEGKHDAFPDISNSAPGGYGAAGAHQYEKLERAIELDRDAALWSTSWGLGQVMGFNAVAAGFANMESMIDEMRDSENAQLIGMTRFMLKGGLDQALRVGDWTTFARKYNGKNYHINKYDDRLRGAYQKFATGPLPDLVVRESQLLLSYLGYDPGLIDGWFGSNTLRALNHFRAKAGLPETDKLGSSDLKLLRKDGYA